MDENPRSRPPLARWLTAGVFESKHRAQQAHSVQFLMLSIYFVATVLLSVLIVLQPDTLARRGVTLLMLTAMAATILIVNRKWPQVAGLMLVGGLLILITERNLAGGGINAPATGMYVVIVLIAGVLFGVRVGVLFAFLTAAAALLLALVEITGNLPEREIEFSPLITWLYNCLWVGLALMVQIHVSRHLRGLLNQANSELAERKRAQHRLDLALSAGRIGVWEMNPETQRISADEFLFDLYDLEPRPDGTISRAEWRGRVHSEDRAKADASIERLLEGASLERISFRVLRTDGTTVYVDGAASVPGGDTRRIVGVNVDVTERQLAENELAERAKELGLLHTTARVLQGERNMNSELLQQLVSLLPPAWQFPDVCEARISCGELAAQTAGWKDTEWVQSVNLETGNGELSVKVAYTEERPLAAEGPFLEEERAVLRSFGEMLVAYIALRRHQEGLEQLVETRTQELKTSYERLQNLEMLRDDLVHMIVHDMRSPLTALMMSLDLLKRKFGTDLAMPMEAALRTTSMLNLMANNLLDVSRLEEGKMPLQRSNVDISELAGETATALQMLDQSRKVELQASQSARASCDRGLIRRVLENLVSNGFKHTPRGSTLRVVVTPTSG